VKFAPRFIAALVLLGWLFAIGHLATEHGAGAFSGVDHELIGHDDDHQTPSLPDARPILTVSGAAGVKANS